MSKERERPFYADLVNFMGPGPVMIQVLEGENAIFKNPDIMVATNSKEENCFLFPDFDKWLLAY